MSEFREIKDTRIVGTVLLMGPGWREPGVGCQHEDGEWYSPADGTGFSPDPTHWAPFPPFEHIRARAA